MKSPTRILFCGLAALLVAGTAQAAFITVSASAPTVDGADIAVLTGIQGNTDSEDTLWSNKPSRGQTFTTASNAAGYDLSAFSFYNNIGWSNPNGAAIDVRVRNSGGTILLAETGLAPRSNGTWVTAALASSVHLAPNTTYGIEFQSFTDYPAAEALGGTWDGFAVAKVDTDYTGGTAYTTPNGTPITGPMTAETFDRAFHVNLTASSEVSPVPEPSSMLGLGCLVGAGALLRTRRRND